MIGGGKYLDPKSAETKEDADHSLHYMTAAALLDGQLEPAQFELSRIQSQDVQKLLKKVRVKPSGAYTRIYPQTMSCRIRVKLADGRMLKCEKRDFEGFHGRPMPLRQVTNKFLRLAGKVASARQLDRIIDCVLNLEMHSSRDLIAALRLTTD
jgi:2-methylcitrate dehydratase